MGFDVNLRKITWPCVSGREGHQLSSPQMKVAAQPSDSGNVSLLLYLWICEMGMFVCIHRIVGRSEWDSTWVLGTGWHGVGVLWVVVTCCWY